MAYKLASAVLAGSLALAFVTPVTAQTTTLTFDSPSTTRLPTMTRVNSDTEGNYVLTRQTGTIQPGFTASSGGNLFFPGSGRPEAQFILKTVDGSLFTLNSYQTLGLGSFFISGIQPQTATQGPSAFAYTTADFNSTAFVTHTNSYNGVDYSNDAVSEIDFSAYTYQGSTGLNLDNVVVSAFTPAAPSGPAVPEPAAWAMLVLGTGAVGYALRRRRTTVQFSYAA